MSAPLILTVTPRGKPGIFFGKIEGTELVVRATRNPLLSAARSLLSVGVNPATILILRNAGSSIDRLSGRLDVIVRKMARKGPRSSPVRYGGKTCPAVALEAGRPMGGLLWPY